MSGSPVFIADCNFDIIPFIMLNFDLEKALLLALEYRKNQSPIKKQALEDMLAMA